MARVNYTSPSLTPPAWAGDFLNRMTLVPGGARVNPADTGFPADAQGRKLIRSGTVLGRTFAERSAGTGFGLGIDTDDELYILAFDVVDASFNADCELYRDGLVKENFLPGWNTMTAELRARVRSRYQCIVGVA